MAGAMGCLNCNRPKKARGVCSRCRSRFAKLVKDGTTTWEQLGLEGKALPPTPKGSGSTMGKIIQNEYNGRMNMKKAFTLIELLVVLAIMAALMVMVLLFLPKRSVRATNDGASQLQTYIASAKSRAMRDRSPRGIRLLPDTNGDFREFQFVEVPEPYAPVDHIDPITKQAVMPQLDIAVGSSSVFIQYEVSGSIARGDMIQIGGDSNSPHRIAADPVQVSATTWQVDLFTAPDVASMQAYKTTSGYSFIRQPKPLLGEPVLYLPKGVLVDSAKSVGLLQGYGGHTDLMFAPGGGTIGGTQGRVVLWLRADDSNAPVQLITIYARTGGVAVHPVAPGGNPLAYTQDGRSSGQ